MTNYVQVGEGTYFYCIDCTEKYKLTGQIKDLRLHEGNKQIQCFSCGKITYIYTEDSRKLRSSGNSIFGRQPDGTWVEPNANDFQTINIVSEPVSIIEDGVAEWWLKVEDSEKDRILSEPVVTITSTRPACPVCEKGTLTGELYKVEKDKALGAYFVGCDITNCFTTVYLNESWEITGYMFEGIYCQYP